MISCEELPADPVVYDKYCDVLADDVINKSPHGQVIIMQVYKIT